MSRQRIKQLKKLLDKYDKAYYDESRPLITDAEYDEIKKEYLFLLEKEQNSLDLFKDLPRQVGYAPNQRFKIIKHQIPMLSLDNVNNQEDFLEYLKKIKRFLNLDVEEKLKFTCELKIDGLSFSARYEKGKLAYVLTRGDGIEGEDVTLNVKQIKDFPQEISMEMDVFEVRGEIYLSKEDFLQLNQNLEEKEKFSNPRNAASGTLRNLDPSLVKERNLKYFAYSLGEADLEKLKLTSQYDLLKLLKSFNFNIANDNNIISTDSLEEIFSYYSKTLNDRYLIPFDIDGIVVKTDSLVYQKRLGSTSNAQRWAIAYKFPAEEVKSKILDVAHQIGRTGILTPVALLQPVSVGGVLIGKATMHNYDDIEKKNLSIGSLVLVKRAGDVIPYIVKSCNEGLSAEELKLVQKIQIPKLCPCCKSEIFIDKTSNVTMAKCLNRKNCKEQIIQSFAYFTSRDALDIKGLGEKNIQKFYEMGFVKTFSDIWSLKNFKEQIIKLEGFGEKSFSQINSAIEGKMEISFSKFLYSLGIEGVGEVNALKIAQFFGSIQKLEEIIADEVLLKKSLEEIDGIGSEVTKSFLQYVSDTENLKELINLKNILTIKEETLKSNLPFQGKSVVFTGQISISRQEAKSLAQKLGFKVLSSVSKNLDFLIAGEDSGSKLKQAKELGVRILTEEEWKILINSGTSSISAEN